MQVIDALQKAPLTLQVRHRFPALTGSREHRIRVFADNSSRAQMPDVALDAVMKQLLNHETHRGGNYAWDSRRATEMAVLRERARRAAADFCGGQPSQIGFGANGTSALAILARAMFGTVLKAGDRIVVTEVDHDANRAPWHWLQRQGCHVIDVPVAADGGLDMDAWRQAMTERPALVAICMLSNVTGVLLPVDELAAQARAAGSVVVLDAVQGPPHGHVDVMQCGVDVAIFSNCKLFSPHLGWWAMREDLLERIGLSPAYGFHPELEWGTFSHAGFAGFVETHSYFCELTPASDLHASMKLVRHHEAALARRFQDLLPEALRTNLLAAQAPYPRAPIFSIAVGRPHWSQVRRAFEEAGIDVRIGQFGCPSTLRRLAAHTDDTALRLSFVHYNSLADIDAVCDVLQSLQPIWS